MIRVCVIGIGSFGKNHARVYAEMPGVDLAGICDPNPEHMKGVRKNGAREYVDYKEMLDKEKPDIVSLVVPTKLHYKIALEVLNRGINLLVEKPIASTVEEAKEIIEAAARNNVKLTVGHIERFNPAIIELKKRLDNGELGKVYKLSIDRVGPFPTRIRDVGVVIDLAVHDLDIARTLVNDEIDHLYARTSKQIHTDHEDMLAALLTFKNGAVCNLNINWLTPQKLRTLRIVGEKGLFVADYLKQELTFHENAELANNFDYADIMRGVSVGNTLSYSIRKKEPLLAELEHFVDCVANDKQPLVSGDDGLKALDLALDLINASNGSEIIRK